MGSGARLVEVDLTDAPAVAEVVRRLLAGHERIDVLLNLPGGSLAFLASDVAGATSGAIVPIYGRA